MKQIKYLTLAVALITIILGVVSRVLLPGNVLFGLGGLTYLRLTVVMLLFALTFHFLFSER
jgi:galactitol-specific phosphotransferase system IIC component